MGQRGKLAPLRHTMPGCAEYQELIDGPVPESRYKIDVMRRRWKNGGREAVEEHYHEPGKRAWAWWRWEVPRRDLVWALVKAPRPKG
jgi:hypothetical protein